MERFGQSLTALWETQPLLLASAGLLLGVSLLGAIYVLRQLRGDTQQAEAWPHRLYRWLQANALGVALIVTTLCFAGLVTIAIWVWLNPPFPAVTTVSSAPAPPVQQAVPLATPEPYTIQMVDQNGTPLALLTPAALLAVEVTAPLSPTASPMPLNPYLVINPQEADYYVEPNSLPLRFGSITTATVTLTVTGHLTNINGGQAVHWLQVCCIATATRVWVRREAITLYNTPAWRYVPTVTLPTHTPTPTPLFTATPTATPTAPYLRLAEGEPSANLFAGPAETFPHVAQLGPNVDLEINGKTTDGNWLRVCCIDFRPDNNTLWVRKNQTIEILNAQALNIWATPVVVSATPVPFEKNKGPVPLGIANNFFTIYTLIAGNAPFFDKPLPGYFLGVEFQPKGQIGFTKRESTNRGEADALRTSEDKFSTDLKDVVFNHKFEYTPSGAFVDGDWQFWLTNAAGDRLSGMVQFTSDPMHRGVYVVWHQVR